MRMKKREKRSQSPRSRRKEGRIRRKERVKAKERMSRLRVRRQKDC